MKRTITKTTLIFLTACLLPAGAKSFALTLVEKGQAKAVMLVSKTAPKATSFAAKEVAHYIQKMTGVELDTIEVDENAGPGLQALTSQQNAILVGDSRIARELGLSSKNMVPGALRIVCRGKALAVLGKDDADVDPARWNCIGSCGTVYAVYRLLDGWGVRWYFPGETGEVVSRRETLELPDAMDLSDAPFFPMRLAEPPLAGAEASLWMRRVGFGASVDPAATCHSFTSWHRKYFETHPEYFALHGDKRLDHICFYGEGVRQRMIDQAQEYLRKADPQRYPYFTVMENDGSPGPCQCAECRKRLTPEQGWYGTMSDYMAETALEVARGIQAEFPDRGVVIGAYNEYTRPPLRVKKLPPNVAVQIFRHRQQLWSAEARKNVYAVVEGWSALKPKTISFWDYYNFDCWAGCRWLGVPAVTTRLIDEDIKRLKQLSRQSGVPFLGEMTFCDGRAREHHQQRLWWLGLDLYVTGKCLWNPDLDRKALLKEFFGEYFGPAAPAMEKLYSRAEEVWGCGDHGGRNLYAVPDGSLSQQRLIKEGYLAANPWKFLFTQAILAELDGYLKDAKDLAKDWPYRERIEMVGDGLAFTQARAKTTLQSAMPRGSKSPTVDLSGRKDRRVIVDEDPGQERAVRQVTLGE